MNIPPLELAGLFNACMDGHATDEQITRLNALLRTNSVARDLYLQLADTHSTLSVDEQLWVEDPVESRVFAANSSARQGSWFDSFTSRPVTAAALGLVVGLFSASVLFAYVMPLEIVSSQKIVPLFAESFEDQTIVPQRRFPTSAEVWSGDLSSSIPAEAEFKPKDGERMVRLSPVETRKFSYAWRIVDVDAHPLPSGSKSRQLEVTASFRGNNPGISDRYQIRLAAFSEEPAEVKAIWNGPDMFDQVLQHVGRTVTTKPDDQGWKQLRATIEIPPGTRSLVISLAAGVADDSIPKTTHYLDDVHAKFFIREGKTK